MRHHAIDRLDRTAAELLARDDLFDQLAEALPDDKHANVSNVAIGPLRKQLAATPIITTMIASIHTPLSALKNPTKNGRSATRMNKSGRAIPRNCSWLRQRASTAQPTAGNDVGQQIGRLGLFLLAVVVAGSCAGIGVWLPSPRYSATSNGGSGTRNLVVGIDEGQLAQESAVDDSLVRPERLKPGLQGAETPATEAGAAPGFPRG